MANMWIEGTITEFYPEVNEAETDPTEITGWKWQAS